MSFKKMHILSLLIGLFFLFQNSQCRHCIRGRVIDEKTLQPIHYADAFLSHTHRGTATDNDGYFKISRIPSSHYTLIVHHVGYETRVISIDLSHSLGDSLTLKILLTPKVLQGQAVGIIGEKPDFWKTCLKYFKKEFFGLTYNHRSCQLLNPAVLRFTFDEKNQYFKAEADSMLIVENNATGYHIKIVLQQFEMTGGILNYTLYPCFQVMESNSRRKKAIWQKNRIRTFEGSAKHFFCSVYYKDFPDHQKFKIYRTHRTSENVFVNDWHKHPCALNAIRLIDSPSNAALKHLELHDHLIIQYRYSMFHQTISLLMPLKNSILIDGKGNVMNPPAYKTSDNWAAKRVADMLPMDYLPHHIDSETLTARPEQPSIHDYPFNTFIAMDSLPDLFMNRILISSGDCLFLSGGLHQENKANSMNIRQSTSLLKYVPSERYTLSWMRTLQPRSSHAAALTEKHLYLLGGDRLSSNRFSSSLLEPAQTMEVLNIKTAAIDTIIPLPMRLSRAGAIQHEKHIYLFGGIESNTFPPAFQSSVYQFNTESRQWQTKADMPTARCCQCILYRDTVYAIGGSGKEYASAKAFEAYSIAGNSWTVLPDLPIPMENHACVLFENKIFCFCWHNQQSSVLQYDLDTSVWQTLTTRGSGFHQAQAAVTDKGIYLFGGFDEHNQIVPYIQLFIPENKRNR